MNNDGTFNVMVLGGGGREHALAMKMRESDIVRDVIVTPGNLGMVTSGGITTVGYDLNDFEGIAKMAKETMTDLVVVGPEVPLVNGIKNYWEENRIANETGDPFLFGPPEAAANLEGSKIFAKNLMKKYGIPTADYFVPDSIDKAISYVRDLNTPDMVIKANGLALGKGAIVCHTLEEQIAAINNLMNPDNFGGAGKRIIIEEFMEGEEASIFAISDGKDYKVLISSQDHKPIGEGDTGLNTGGMGAYAPAPVVTPSIMKLAKNGIFTPTFDAMKELGTPFTGCLYGGIMIVDGKPKVVEFNVRLGDPEAQVVLPMLDRDLFDIMYSSVNPNHEVEFSKIHIKNHPGYATNVVFSAPGYPGSYEKGIPVEGIEKINDIEGATFYHAGTTMIDGKVFSIGGRVGSVTGTGKTLQESIDTAYKGINQLNIEDFYSRPDIGAKGLKH